MGEIAKTYFYGDKTHLNASSTLTDSVCKVAKIANLVNNNDLTEFDPDPVPYFRGDDHEIISTVILLPSTKSFKKGCCQLQAKLCARSTGQLLVQAYPGKNLVR